MSLTRHYLTNVGAQGLSRIVAAAANLVVFVLVARCLGSDALGQFSYVLAFLAVATSFADLGTGSVLARGLAQTAPALRGDYLGQFLILRLVLAVIVVGGAAFAATRIYEPLTSALLVCALGVPFVTSRFLEYVFQVQERPWFALLSSSVYAMVLVLAAFGIVVWAHQPLLPFVVGYMCAHVLYTLVASRLAWRLLVPRLRWDWPAMRSMLILAAPLGVSSIFTMLNSRADTFLLTYLRTQVEVGVYNAAYRFLDAGTLVALALSTPLIPVLARKWTEGPEAARRTYRRVIETIAVGAVPLAIATPLLSGVAIRSIYGAEFTAAGPVLNVLAWVQVILLYCLVSSSMNLATGDVHPAYWNAAIATAANVSLNLVLIPRFGILGAAWATLASEILLLSVSQYYVVKRLGRVVNASHWLRIAALNVMLGALLLAGRRYLGAVTVVPALAAYAWLVFKLQLVPLRSGDLRPPPGSSGPPPAGSA